MPACTQCDRTLEESAFGQDRRRGTVRQPCRECANAANRHRRSLPAGKAAEKAYKAANRDKYREYNRAYRRRNEGAETVRTRKWSAQNPEKRQAHRKLWREIMGGRITRRPCEVCGEPRAQAHHDDYSRPLDVRWLCPLHHAEVHALAARNG